MSDLENKFDDVAGKAKEAAGGATGNDDLKNEGKADQVGADFKEKASDAADAVKDKANEVIGKFKKD